MPLIRDAVIGPKAKMTQADLAAKMGLSASAISQWFREGEGSNRPDPWNTLRALKIVGAPKSKVRAHFYGLETDGSDAVFLADAAKALGLDGEELAALGSGSNELRAWLMDQRDEVRRAALAVMLLEERTLDDVRVAAEAAIADYPNEERDPQWWVGKISGALRPKHESGERPSVRALLPAPKV